LRNEAEICPRAVGNKFGNVADKRRMILQVTQPVSLVFEEGVDSDACTCLHNIKWLSRLLVQEENGVL
jgi:hypothetical protein